MNRFFLPSLDTRSLSLFRITLGLTTAIFAYKLLFVVPEYFGSHSFIPLALVGNSGSNWSFHFISNAYLWQYCVLVTIIVAALAFTAGYKTRLLSIILWLLLVSLYFRIGSILNTGEKIQYVLYLWASVLPIGQHFTYKDLSLRIPVRSNFNYTSMSVVGFSVQIAFIFILSVYHKWNNASWMDGSTVYKSLFVETYISPLAYIVRELPYALLYTGTYAVMALEVIGPLCIIASFIPSRYAQKLQGAGVIMLLFLCITFGTVFIFGTFPYVLAAATFAFIPSSWWNHITTKVNFIRARTFEYTHTYTESINISIVSTILLLIITWGNFHELNRSVFPISQHIKNRVYIPFKLHQHWPLYAQTVFRTAWISAEATTKNNQQFDVWKWYVEYPNQTITREQPPNPLRFYKDAFQRNYLYFHVMYSPKYQGWFLYNLCTEYNKTADDPIVTIDLYTAWQVVEKYNTFAPAQSTLVYPYTCKQ